MVAFPIAATRAVLVEPFLISCLCSLLDSWFVGIGADHDAVFNPGIDAFASKATVASAETTFTR
jgi:hypothetical protein